MDHYPFIKRTLGQLETICIKSIEALKISVAKGQIDDEIAGDVFPMLFLRLLKRWVLINHVPPVFSQFTLSPSHSCFMPCRGRHIWIPIFPAKQIATSRCMEKNGCNWEKSSGEKRSMLWHGDLESGAWVVLDWGSGEASEAYNVMASALQSNPFLQRKQYWSSGGDQMQQ